MTIWVAEDKDEPVNSGFGETKTKAISYVTGNYGYDAYDGSARKAAKKDGWLGKVYPMKVPVVVGRAMLAHCQEKWGC